MTEIQNNTPEESQIQDLSENPGCFPQWIPSWVRKTVIFVLGPHLFEAPKQQNVATRAISAPSKKESEREITLEDLKRKVKELLNKYADAIEKEEYFLPEYKEIFNGAVDRFLSDSPGYEMHLGAYLPKNAKAQFSFGPTFNGLSGSVKLPDSFDERRDWDLLELIHELAHGDHVFGNYEKLGHNEFVRRHNEESQRFGVKAALLYSEARSHMIQLLLADILSGGLFRAYVEEAGPAHASGGFEASNRIAERYVPQIAERLNVPDNRFDMNNVAKLMRLASAIFTREPDAEKPWPASYVSELVRDYARVGIETFIYMPADCEQIPDGVMYEYLESPARAIKFMNKDGEVGGKMMDI
ncbi:hypothetical protein KKC94_02245 [Patescibacteria group bacterium]|nr:hypothetical protein [Patescibacteria group bacterium]